MKKKKNTFENQFYLYIVLPIRSLSNILELESKCYSHILVQKYKEPSQIKVLCIILLSLA